MSYSVHVFKKTKLQTFTNRSTNPIALVENKENKQFVKIQNRGNYVVFTIPFLGSVIEHQSMFKISKIIKAISLDIKAFGIGLPLEFDGSVGVS